MFACKVGCAQQPSHVQSKYIRLDSNLRVAGGSAVQLRGSITKQFASVTRLARGK